MDRRLSTPVTSVRALNPPFSNSRGCCMRADPVSRRATVTHRPPFREGRRVVAALNHLSSPRDQTSLLPSSPAPLSLSLSPLHSFHHLPAATIHANRRWWSGRRWCGVAWRGSSYARPIPPVRRVVFEGKGSERPRRGGRRRRERKGRRRRRSKSRRRERSRQRQRSVQVCTRANFEGGMREGGGTVIHRYAFQRRSFTTVGKWKEGKEDDEEKRAEKRVHEKR